MSKLIIDEFTRRPVSRQRKYQLRKQRDGRCTECGEPTALGARCLKHLVRAREHQRKRLGLKRRYYNTRGYGWGHAEVTGPPTEIRDRTVAGRLPGGTRWRVARRRAS